MAAPDPPDSEPVIDLEVATAYVERDFLVARPDGHGRAKTFC